MALEHVKIIENPTRSRLQLDYDKCSSTVSIAITNDDDEDADMPTQKPREKIVATRCNR